MPNFLHTLRFQYQVLKRMAAVAPRKSKKIKMLYIEYADANHNSEQLLIKYRFRNAIWYTVNNTKTVSTRAVLPKAAPAKEVNLTVHGFFRKNIYTLLLKPEYIHVIKTVHL
jgi:S-adenosylmethionine:tRNA-ribosyltransferase-isomerase (queuine synthetase)